MQVHSNLMKVVSGGQTGADQAALVAARLAGIETGGWAPKDWLTEDGPMPMLAGYGLKECPKPGYPARTAMNVKDSDGTVVFWNGQVQGRGSRLTENIALRMGKPVISGPVAARTLAQFIRQHNIQVLNVAGSRASADPNIGEFVERELGRCFMELGLHAGT